MATFSNYLSTLSFSSLVELWNTYGVEHDPDSYIYGNIAEYCDLHNPDVMDVVKMVFFGEVESIDDAVYLDGYGNFKGCYNLASSPIDLGVLAEEMEADHNELWKAWAEEQEEQEEQEAE